MPVNYGDRRIFLYYIGATLFPVDKIIGKLYPLFGALLLVGTFAIFAVLIVEVIHFHRIVIIHSSRIFNDLVS